MSDPMDTGELLAVRFPNSHHLFADLEEACSSIKERGNGWGRIGIDMQGVDLAGKLLVQFLDVQLRIFRVRKPKQHNKS